MAVGFPKAGLAVLAPPIMLFWALGALATPNTLVLLPELAPKGVDWVVLAPNMLEVLVAAPPSGACSGVLCGAAVLPNIPEPLVVAGLLLPPKVVAGGAAVLPPKPNIDDAAEVAVGAAVGAYLKPPPAA